MVYGRPPPTLLSYVRGTARVQEAGSGRCSFAMRSGPKGTSMTPSDCPKSKETSLWPQPFGEKIQRKRYGLRETPPHRQGSITRRVSQKLAARFYGPFRVLSKMGKVGYKLELPLSSRVHLVFYVSLLKKRVGENMTPSSILPDIEEEVLEIQKQLESILSVCGPGRKQEFLVKGLRELWSIGGQASRLLSRLSLFSTSLRSRIFLGGVSC